MRISYFSDFFFPQIGGIQVSTSSLVKELSRRGHKIDFYVPRYPKRYYRSFNVPETETDLGANARIIRLSSVPFILEKVNQSRVALPGPFRLTEIVRNKPDVMHIQTFGSIGLAATLASKIGSIPLIGTNHLDSLHFKQIISLYFKYIPWFYNHCDYVTTPCQWSFDEMAEHGLNRSHEVISNPIDTITFHPDRKNEAATKKKYNLSKHTMVFVGRISSEKDLDVIVRALPKIAESVPDVCFVIVGRGSEEKSLKELGKKLGVEDKMKFPGFLNARQVNELHNASELFTIASTSETQGMVMLEAMACALPVLAARAMALPEYANSENGVLFEPGDYETLAKNAVSLFKDGKTSARLGKNGRKYVEQFSVSNIADRWEKIYEKVINGYK